MMFDKEVSWQNSLHGVYDHLDKAQTSTISSFSLLSTNTLLENFVVITDNAGIWDSLILKKFSTY